MDLLTGNIKRAYFRYLSAAFGSALISSIYYIVDMAMVGQYQGPDGTAALAVVDRNKSLLQQGEVDAMAQAILDAISGLEKKPAPTPAPAPQVPDADAGQKANPKTGVAK